MWRLSLVGLCLIFGFAYADDKVQCKDEDGRSVDWFVMYKLNVQRTAKDPLIKKGESYIYITSDTVSTGWRLTKKGVESETAMLSYTLSPIYKTGREKNIRVMYNDQISDGKTNPKRGHAKGVVIANQNEGLWLVHSVPRFPEKGSSKYSYSKNGKKFGQSVLCISVKSNQIETIAKQLNVNQVIIYDGSYTKELRRQYPTLGKLINKEFIDNTAFNKATIYSAAGLEFTSFAKSAEWNGDLYHDYVAPELGSALYVRTWRSENKNINSVCKNIPVYNIQQITMNIPGVTPISRGQDHSKWAISKHSGNHGSWVCIGDINRAVSQKQRGGGTVCVKLPQLWRSYKSLVGKNGLQPCPH